MEGSDAPVIVRGSGSIGMRHLETIRALGRRAIAVPVRSERAPEIAARGFEVARSIAEAVERGARAAIIATDTGRHLDDATEALALGCDVLVEKPVAASSDGVDRLAAKSAETQRRVHVAYCLRFERGLQTFRARLADAGELHAVRIACQSYLPDWRPDRDHRASYSARSAEGGVLRDLSHEIDYALWLYGPPSAVGSTLSSASRLGIEAEESADLSWRTATGVVVSLRLDYLTRRARRTMLAQGAAGEIEWDAIAGTIRIARGAADERVDVPPDRDAMMRRQLEAFLAPVPPPELCTLEEARLVMSICDAARRSSESKREEMVRA